MATIDLRNKVRTYVDTADKKLLKLIKALAESYQDNEEEEEEELTMSEAQYNILDKRREAHLKNESPSFTWEQVKQNARNASK